MPTPEQYRKARFWMSAMAWFGYLGWSLFSLVLWLLYDFTAMLVGLVVGVMGATACIGEWGKALVGDKAQEDSE